VVVHYDRAPRNEHLADIERLRTPEYKRLVALYHDGTRHECPQWYEAQFKWLARLSSNMDVVTDYYQHERDDVVYAEIVRMLTTSTSSSLTWHKIPRVMSRDWANLKHKLLRPFQAIRLRILNKSASEEELRREIRTAIDTVRGIAVAAFSRWLDDATDREAFVAKVIPPPPDKAEDLLPWLQAFEDALKELERNGPWRA
jgi:hypothetical protein